MNENHGAATKLLYQLFIALGRKAKKNLTGVAMETMRPSAPVKLESIESVIHKEVLIRVHSTIVVFSIFCSLEYKYKRNYVVVYLNSICCILLGSELYC